MERVREQRRAVEAPRRAQRDDRARRRRSRARTRRRRTRTSRGSTAMCIQPARRATASAGDPDADAARAPTPRTAPRGAPPCRARTGAARRPGGPRRRPRRTSAAPRRDPSRSAAPRRRARASRSRFRRRASARSGRRPRRPRPAPSDAAGSRRRLERGSEVAAQGLFALDRLEQRLEVALAEGARAVALDHLEEERRPVLHRLREDLEQVPVLVAVDEDAEPPQVAPRLRRSRRRARNASS